MEIQVDTYCQSAELADLQGDWSRLCMFKEASFINYSNKVQFSPKILSPIVAVAREHGHVVSIWAGWLEQSSFREVPFYRRLLGKYKKIVFHANYLMGKTDKDVAGSLYEAISTYTKSQKYISILFGDISDELQEQLNLISLTDQCHNCHISINHRPHYFSDLSNPAALKKVKKLHRKSRTPDKCDCSPIALQTFTQFHELDEFYAIARRISSTSLKTKHGYPFRETPEWLEKYSQFSKEDSLRCFVLSLENEPAAYLITYFHNNIAYFDQSNFSFKFGHYCPGIYLLIKAIESMHDKDHIETLDFGAGENVFKQRLSTIITYESDIHIFTPSLLSKLYYLCIICMERLISLRNRVFPMLRPYYCIKLIKRLLYIKELKKT